MRDTIPMDISIVIPVRNEVESVRILAEEIAAALADSELRWEVVWIDDGSADGTRDVLMAVHEGDRRHRPLLLARPQGQSAALVAGFRRARAPRIVTLDGDLQNDPGDIPSLLATADRTGLDVVNGVRRGRQDSRLRRVSSRVANGFRNRVTGESVTDVGCSLRVFPAEAARRVPSFRGMHRFLPTLLRLQGCTVGEVEVRHRPRRHGRTKYGVGNRLWVGLLDTFGVWWLKRRWAEPECEGAAGIAASTAVVERTEREPVMAGDPVAPERGRP